VASGYSPREEQALTIMYRHRRAGNAFPDRDAGLLPADRRWRFEVIID